MHFKLELDKLWVKLQVQGLDPKLVKLKSKPKSSQKTLMWVNFGQSISTIFGQKVRPNFAGVGCC
jgi:hypothetical protein